MTDKKSKKDDGKSTLEEKLLMKRPFSWEGMDAKKEKAVFEFSEKYKSFLDSAKTERLAAKEVVKQAEAHGFKPICETDKLKAGDKVYAVNKHKNVILSVIGKGSIGNGINIVASHMDAPRLDLKQNPLYEDKDTQMAILRTHYYGGIKKYQWVANPLALVGTVVLRDGKAVDVSIGLGDDEPVFMAPDLLPHLGHKEQEERKSKETIRGEELQIVVGNMPVSDKKVKDKIKIRVLEFLNKKYGMVEEDFISAEIEAVPIGKARDVGLDRSMIGAYGQDDRICSYTSMAAIFDAAKSVPERTAIALFVDKEEIGSDSNTGIKSKFLYNFVTEILERSEEGCGCETMIVMSRCKALSADVNAGVEPNFKQVHEMSNASKIGFGVVVTKFTGSGGKYTANDANAEFVGEIRVLFNKHKVAWQTGELGKVDEGGGGTVAKFLAEYAMDVIDCGPALLSMHSTFEVSSKADVYAAYEAYKAFFIN